MNSVAGNQASMVLLTYTLHPDAQAAGYDDWLRRIDNPTFNRTPGIVRYQNWKVAAGHRERVPFSHFDLVQIDGAESLEQVWFDEPLDHFRNTWVEKWGNYGSGGGAPVNTLGYLSARCANGGRPRSKNLVFAGGDADAVTAGADFDGWRIDELVRKHWALGPATPEDPWRRDAATGHDLGFGHFHIKFIGDASEYDGAQGAISQSAGPVFLGELIASPD